MRNKAITLLLAASFCFLLTACNDDTSSKASEAGKPLGVVVEERIYKESMATQAAVAHLDKLSTELQAELEAMKQQVDKNPNDKALQEQLNSRFLEMQQRFALEQENVSSKVLEMYSVARATILKKENFSMLINSEQVLEYDPALDVTSLIIEEMNKATIDFSVPVGSANGTAPSANATAPSATVVPSVNATAPATNGTAQSNGTAN